MFVTVTFDDPRFAGMTGDEIKVHVETMLDENNYFPHAGVTLHSITPLLPALPEETIRAVEQAARHL